MPEQTDKTKSSRHHFRLGDEDLGVLDEKRFSISDAILIKNATGGPTGLTAAQFFKGLESADPVALQALVWFLRFKKGQQVHISTVDFAINDLEEVADEPDPTPAPTGTSDASTSEPSPNFSATPPETSTL